MWKQCESLQATIVDLRRQLHQIPEVFLAESLGGGVEFIGHHGNTDPPIPQSLQQGEDPVVGLGIVLADGGVGGLEIRQDGQGGLLVAPCRDGAADEQLHSVAHEHTHLLPRAKGKQVGGQGGVDGAVEILQGVQEGAVQVEYGGGIGHTSSP